MPDASTSTSSGTSSGTLNHEVLEPLAGLLAVLFPGAGHLYLKQTWRGVGVAVGVLGLFFGGILIGGIDVVDRKEDRIWFIGQALVGPIAIATDRYHQSRFKAYEPTQTRDGATIPGKYRSGYPGEQRLPVASGSQTIYIWQAAPGARPPNTKSVAHLNEIGTLFATIAGMLNLIAILDALFHRERRAEIDPAGSIEPDPANPANPDDTPDPTPGLTPKTEGA